MMLPGKENIGLASIDIPQEERPKATQVKTTQAKSNRKQKQGKVKAVRHTESSQHSEGKRYVL